MLAVTSGAEENVTVSVIFVAAGAHALDDSRHDPKGEANMRGLRALVVQRGGQAQDPRTA
jgi:hypothetical protein